MINWVNCIMRGVSVGDWWLLCYRFLWTIVRIVVIDLGNVLSLICLNWYRNWDCFLGVI